MNRLFVIAVCLGMTTACSAAPPPTRESNKPPPPTQTAIESVDSAPAVEQPRAQFWLRDDPVQGGISIGRAPSDAVAVTFNGSAITLDREGFFLIGFDRDAENSASLTATLNNGKTVNFYVPVKPGNWRIENVNANPTGGAGTTAEFQARRGPELARINAARTSKADSGGWRQQFIRPVAGRISGFFGAQRIYRGTPGSYHSGMDIAAIGGTPFVAPADGVIVLAASEEFTLEGHLLMIDHGMGLNSAFLHCSELLVKEGDRVKQGQVIGKVGMTGRASGPHLHWGMKWNNARVDPKLLIPAG
jgi:murein DD-endopeptidase MepM/ murein hydrolase activator NlpD